MRWLSERIRIRRYTPPIAPTRKLKTQNKRKNSPESKKFKAQNKKIQKLKAQKLKNQDSISTKLCRTITTITLLNTVSIHTRALACPLNDNLLTNDDISMFVPVGESCRETWIKWRVWFTFPLYPCHFRIRITCSVLIMVRLAFHLQSDPARNVLSGAACSPERRQQ